MSPGSPALPSGWYFASIGDLVSKISNGFTCKQHRDKLGVAVSRIETISSGSIDLDRVGYVEGVSSVDREKWRVRSGDILFSHINSDTHLGKTALFDLPGVELLHGMNLLLLRPDSSLINSAFLNYWLISLRVGGYFQSIAQHAVNQSSINIAKLNRVGSPVPPLPEQSRIVAKIEETALRP